MGAGEESDADRAWRELGETLEVPTEAAADDAAVRARLTQLEELFEGAMRDLEDTLSKARMIDMQARNWRDRIKRPETRPATMTARVDMWRTRIAAERTGEPPVIEAVDRMLAWLDAQLVEWTKPGER